MTSMRWIGDSGATSSVRSAPRPSKSLGQSRQPGTHCPLMVLATWLGLFTGQLELGLVYAPTTLWASRP